MPIDVVAWMDVQSHNNLFICSIVMGTCNNGIFVAGLLLLLALAVLRLADIFQYTIVVAWNTGVGGINEPQPTTTLCEEESVLIGVEPLAPLLRGVKSAEGVACEYSLGTCFLYALLPQTDCTVNQPDIVVGKADSLVISLTVEEQLLSVLPKNVI